MKPSRQTNSSRRKPQSLEALRELQRLMARAITRPLTAGQGMQPRWPDGRRTAAMAANFIKPNDRLTSFERLEIYNRQYWWRILDCFYDDFPGLRAVLGDRRFRRLAQDYLERHPSRSFTLRDLGRELVAYVEAGEWPRLALDMARLEWAHIEAFDNAAREPLTPDQILDRDPSRLRLRLQPHLTLLSIEYPLDEFLIRLREKERFRGEASNAAEDATHRRFRPPPVPKRKPIWLAVHRHRNVVHYKRLEPDAFRILTALKNGRPLGAALRDVSDPDAPVQEWFHDWAALGWFWLASPPRKSRGE